MSMNLPSDSYLFLLLLGASMLIVPIAAAEGAVGQPPSTCKRSCGGIHIPYPFGLRKDAAGESCYKNFNYSLVCNYTSFNPPRLFFGNIEIIGVNISSAQMKILLHVSYDCYVNSSSVVDNQCRWNVTFTQPYRLSNRDNVFTAVGCETFARFRIGRSYGGCISGCESKHSTVEGECSGIGCCRSPIPTDVRLYDTNYYLRDNGSETYKFNPCSYFFIVEKGNYTFHKSDLKSMDKNREFPVVLDWAIRDGDSLGCEEAKKNRGTYACVSEHSECLDSTNGPGYICNCSQGYHGNPYLQGGCEDIDECNTTTSPCKGICENTDGSYKCTCPKGTHSPDPRIQECIKSGLSLTSKLTIGIGCGLAILLVISLTCCLGFQRRKIIALRKKCFERNGGTFLQQTLHNRKSTFKIFSITELEKASNNFNKDQILGQGGYGIVYKGKLEDGRIVAIKRSMVVDEKNGREFANELFILSEINHKNIVKLLGCCLDDEVPMLVYEFISKGTLFNYIHGKKQLPISFNICLRMATEAAEALKYLHTDASPTILHGDVKSSNVLLDENYTAKVSDFGTSTLAPKDKSQFTTFIQGTCGYLDPEYMINGCLTDKSDVFSFGVILVELLTRRTAFNFEASNERERSLALNFISCAQNIDTIEEILDPEIIPQGVTTEVQKVVEIALKCLNLKGEDRPTMKEVAMELESVKGVCRHPWIPSDSEEVEHLLMEATGGTQDAGTMSREIFNIEGVR